MKTIRLGLVLSVLMMGAWTMQTVGQKAPAVTASDWIGGAAVDPTKPNKKNIYVLDFWATWCGPCKESIPQMIEMEKKYKDQGLIVVGITDEDRRTVEPFYKQMKMNYRVALDKNNETHARYHIDSIPQAFVVGKDGKIIWSGHPADLDDAKVEELLKKAK